MDKYLITKNRILALGSILICFLIVFESACRKKEDPLIIYGSSPEPKLPAIPYQYPTMNSDIATLGRVLFYDRNLSLNGSISCGSCHMQAFAFADNHQFSRGLNNSFTSRNSSAIFNSGHSKFWDGRAADFDTAVFMPVMNHLEMDVFNLNLLPVKLSTLSYYEPLFTTAYGNTIITTSKIKQALATFLSCLSSHDSKYDHQQLNGLERQGSALFCGKATCANCHNGQDFNGWSDNYENIGLDVNYPDIGRGRITQDEFDYGKFNVPTLRNIELTAPYMHDGRYKTLREVIDHYSDGLQDSRNLSWILREVPEDSIQWDPFRGIMVNNPSQYPMKRINLTEDEKRALEAFLNTLTDVSFISDPRYSNPF